MANVLSLALKLNADSSGFKLDPVTRALQSLQKEAEKVTSVFDKFTTESEAASRAQENTARQLEALTAARKAGTVSAEEFARSFEAIKVAADKEAAALQRAAQITEVNRTSLERYDIQVAELTEQLNAGRISQETFTRATEGAARGLTDAERSARGLEVATAEIQDNAGETTLRFNELSGVFSALPGPLGNIAGRISGLSSAGQGLSRVFAGGLSQGISGVASSLVGLVNPVTAALAGITAFAAGATAIARGLTQLEDRVENLGNIADKLGVSFGFIQTLEEAANRSGTSIDAVSSAFGRLQKSVLGVDEESKAAQKALSEIGVTAQELDALSPEDQYRRIGEALAAIEDPARRTATATALFGRAGADLLPFFRNLGGAAADMERFGRALTDIDKQRIDDFGKGIDALGVATQGLGQALLLPFAGLGEGVSRAFAEVTAGITAFVDPIGQVLEPVLTQIGRVVEIIGIALGNVGRIIGTVFEPFATVAQAASQALEPLYDGVVNIFRSLSDTQVAVSEWIVSFTPIGVIAANAGALGETLSRVVTIITTAFSKAGEFVGNLARRFADLIAQSPLLKSIGETVSSVFGGVSQVFTTISNAIGGTVGRLLAMAERFLGINREAKGAAAGVEQVAAATEQVTQLGQKSQEALSKAIEQVGQYGQAGFDAAIKYQEALRQVEELIAEEGLTEEQANRARQNATAEYERQIDVVRQNAEEKKRAADAAEQAAKRESDAIQSIIDKQLEQVRIEQDYGGDSARAKNADDLNRIRDEIAKTEAEIARANAAGDAEAAARAVKRLGQLDQVEARLSEAEAKFGDLADQTAQGFADGFDKAFQATTRGLDDLINKAGEFGNEGAIAAQQLQNGIAEAQRQVSQGILNAESYEAQVDAQKKIFNDRLQQLEEERKTQLRNIEEVAKRREEVQKSVDQLIFSSLDQQTQAQIKAAETLKVLEEEKIAVQERLQAAREAGDTQAIKAGQQRIEQIDSLARKEQDIASGAAAQRELYLEQQKQIADTQQQQQQQFLQQQQKAAEERQKAEEAEYNRQVERIRDLSTLGSRTVQTADVRTQEGAALVLDLAANAQDPRLIEARLTTKVLRQIAVGLTQNLNRIGIPAQIGFG